MKPLFPLLLISVRMSSTASSGRYTYASPRARIFFTDAMLT